VRLTLEFRVDFHTLISFGVYTIIEYPLQNTKTRNVKSIAPAENVINTSREIVIKLLPIPFWELHSPVPTKCR